MFWSPYRRAVAKLPPTAAFGSDAARDWAASGVVALTGRPDGPPLVPPGRAATVARRLADRIAERTAASRFPVRLDGRQLLSERAAFTGATRAGSTSAGGSCRLLPTADGWAAVSCARPDDPLLLGALIGAELSGDPWPPVAAWLAAHDGAELAERAELLGIAAAPVRPYSPPPEPPELPARSVAGLRVVDFSALWAGPLCAHLLSLAGAEVITVETPGRPDGARQGNRAFYRLLRGGTHSVVLDPGTAPGRTAIAALVDAADIVVEASRPRALAGFGLDAEAAVASGTTWISVTAAGRASARVGFGDDVAAAAGLVAPDADGVPLFCGDAIADPLTGLTAAALAMTAPADGSGVLWDVAMSDVVARTLVPRVADRAPTARRAAQEWVVDAGDGTVPVAPARRRVAVGPAPASGADTAAVLGRLGIVLP
jgi:crotonobetainyl-CoA:carnitine CoA-transferase CaiB-like acyl-CoA transferase